MRISAKAEYALRAAVELAARGPEPQKCVDIARAQDIPVQFLTNIFVALRAGGLVLSQRGADGGYWLGRPPAQITVAEVLRCVDGPLTTVRGHAPGGLDYQGHAGGLADVWDVLESTVSGLLDGVTLADLLDRGRLAAALGLDRQSIRPV